VELGLADYESPEQWDLAALQQDLLMQYLLQVPAFADGASDRPGDVTQAQTVAVDAATTTFDAKLVELDSVIDEGGFGFSGRMLSLVMLNVLDEKWKDHLYDLDQLRNAIHYRSWGQKDPLVEYKQEAYTMFVDLMQDVYHTFAERFMKAQLVLNDPGDEPPPMEFPPMLPPEPPAPQGGPGPTKRYNAFGILEDVPPEELAPRPESEPKPRDRKDRKKK
jgi:preprotein translocase subunit SecA